MILPMRFRILHLMSKNKGLTGEEVMTALKPEYGSEGQFKKSIIETHLLSMKAVGMIEVCNASLDERGELKETFQITDYGRERLKYLPKEWQN